MVVLGVGMSRVAGITVQELLLYLCLSRLPSSHDQSHIFRISDADVLPLQKSHTFDCGYS